VTRIRREILGKQKSVFASCCSMSYKKDTRKTRFGMWMILLPMVGLLMLATRLPKMSETNKLRGKGEKIGEFVVVSHTKDDVVDEAIMREHDFLDVQNEADVPILETFSCDEIQIPMLYVDDNYCDCKDGKDEPNTAACSMYTNSEFVCKNPHIDLGIQILFASRIDDGVCDCCDGSDEPNISCPNRCQESIPVSDPKGHGRNRHKRKNRQKNKLGSLKLWTRSTNRPRGPIGG